MDCLTIAIMVIIFLKLKFLNETDEFMKTIINISTKYPEGYSKSPFLLRIFYCHQHEGKGLSTRIKKGFINDLNNRKFSKT